MVFQVEITPTALRSLQGISDRRTREAIIRRIDTLSEEPQKLGKALRGELSGFWSVRAAGQRYRIVYWIAEERQQVAVYLVGIRREGSRQDVYALVEGLVRRGLL